jgi:regulator of sigma E protease
LSSIVQTLLNWSAWPFISSIAAAVVALGLLIFVHEFGHFLVAKLFKVGVLKFSLGFGRKIVSRKYGETEYMISAFPLGGYVKMLGEDNGTEELSPEDMKRAFLEQPLYVRAAIVFAGPFFNILLAVAICYIIFLTGFPTAIAKVADVVPGSPAQAAGFKPGDVIEKVDGTYTDIWEQVAEYVRAHPEKKIAFTIKRDDSTVSLAATPQNENGKGSLGLMGTVVIGALMANSPADQAGIKNKDRVVAVNGKKVGAWSDMADVVKANPGKRLIFTIERGGRTFDVTVVPKLNLQGKGEERKLGLIGVQMGSESTNVSYGPVESLWLGAERTYFMTSLTVSFLARLIGGQEDASQIGGPVAIVQISGRQARQGLADFFIFVALLSVNLGVINLFPIPILDGGHLLFFGMEAVMGKPLSMRKRELAQQIGLFMLVALMVFVFYNDIMRLLGFSVMWK